MPSGRQSVRPWPPSPERLAAMPGDLIDPRRTEPSMALAEDRAMLEGWLEFQRTTLLLKVEGLDDEQRKARPVSTSTMSLHGLVRHMTEVEWWWFVRILDGDDSTEGVHDPDGVDADWFPLDGAVWEDDLARWQESCATSRALAEARDLADTGEHPSHGPATLRWIYV